MSVAGHHLPIWFDEAVGPADGEVPVWNPATSRFESVAVVDAIPSGTYAKPPTSGLLADRPAATVIGQHYLATDTDGGTLYGSLDGATWTQLAAGVSGGGGSTPDADAITKGKLQLAGDLGGTAASPIVPSLALKAPLASPTFTGTVTLPAVTAPGAGTQSEKFGASSSANGAQGVALGYAAAAGGANGIAVGFGASSSGPQSLAIGRSSLCAGNGGLAVGYAASCAGTSSVAIGASATSPGASAVVIGSAATSTDGSVVVIGQGAKHDSTISGTLGGEGVAIGQTASSQAWRATAIGFKARAEVVSSTALGRGAIAKTSHGIAIGRGSFTPATGSGGTHIAIGWSGGNSQTDVWFESGHTHKYLDPIDNVNIDRTPSLIPIVIHGFDAFDATDGLAVNVAGGPLVLAAGRGTGTAAGGAVKLQVAPAGGASNNTKNTLVTVVEAGVSTTAPTLGFFAATPVVKPTGVAVTAGGIHAALVSLGLIAA